MEICSNYYMLLSASNELHIEMPFMISVDFLLQTTNTVFGNLSLHVAACTCLQLILFLIQLI